MIGGQFRGADRDALLADFDAWVREPVHVWAAEWQTLATRGVSLVCNDPFAAAMVSAKIEETHGPTGMWLRSAYAERGGTITTAGERSKRREIERIIHRASHGTALDAGGNLTRPQFDRTMDWIATVMGDAWAIRVSIPGRPGAVQAGCWRIITPERVCNPDGQPNGDRYQNGCELDADGNLAAIHVMRATIGFFGVREKPTWERVPIFNPDNGMRQVLHRVGLRVPGMIRGISMFAPALLLMRQMQGVVEAHVTGKRVQAVQPIVYFTDDPDELKAAKSQEAMLGPNAVLGPMSVLVAKYGSSDVKHLNTQFQGADLEAFLTTMYRSLAAMWRMPWQVVLASMGDASLASARAGLDQMDRTAQAYAAEHIEQVSRPMDEAILREADARGQISFATDDWTEITAGRYTRPPKYSTDRLKDANTLKALQDAGVSPTTAFELFGLTYEDEVEQVARDREFADAQGVGPIQQDQQPAQQPQPAQQDDAEDAADDGDAQGDEAEPVDAGAEQ